MENINNWNTIQWKEVEKKVFRLQLRIFKASANQELEKMYKLQKLLISSNSAKYLSIRKVTQEKVRKKTPEIDKILVSNLSERFKLASQLSLDRKSSPFKRIYRRYPNGRPRLLKRSTIKDQAKQMLAYLALCPQWEAQFEAGNYGFRPGRSVKDAIETIFVSIKKTPKWILNIRISKCFNQINHQHIIEKCNTFPEMQQQIKIWLNAGILESGKYTLIKNPQRGIISSLLFNIALDGLESSLNACLNRLDAHHLNKRHILTYVRYSDYFVLIYPNKGILKNLKKVVQQFLEPIGFEMHPIDTQIVHSLNVRNHSYLVFTFLGFDIIQKQAKKKQRKIIIKKYSVQSFITLITPSKEEVQKHKLKIREVIRKYRGASQEQLIQKLNFVIQGWANSKRSQVASKIFQNLDAYLCYHLWKWARKRHPKMSKSKLKKKYWHRFKNKNWVFGFKNNKSIVIKIKLHSKILIKRYLKVKNQYSPFDGNLSYWVNQTKQSY